MRSASKSLLALCAGISVVLGGCGGGGSSGTTTTPTTSTPPAASAVAQLTGTAATGAALANAPVTITNAAGNSPCVETSVTTSALGSYSCTLKAGETAPFFIVVTDPTGDKPPLVSVSTTTPPAGSALTLNVTPLTTAIVAQLVSPADALAVVNSRTVDATQLAAVTGNVVAQLQPVLGAIGVPAGYDPFTTSITAGTPDAAGNTADLVLDVVKVIADPATGQPAITTVDNPTPVALATAASAGSALATPTTGLTTLSVATQIAAQALKNCFALPTSTRVLATDTTLTSQQGGPEVTQAAPECQDIVSDAANGGGINYLHNGYNAGQQFYGLLTSDTMTGAQFSVPEVMAYYPASGSAAPGTPAAYDRAILNLRFVDANGNPGNTITVAARIPGTSTTTRPTEWWLVGNQQTVDTSVKMVIRRTEQLNPAATGNGSTFQAGVQFLVNPIGPGSVLNGNALHLARVKGPGLPAGGLTYITSPNASQTWMDLYNKTGNLTAGSECGNGTTTNCPILWLERTAGTSGTAATTLGTNPTGMLWAQTADGFSPAAMVRPASYTIELFYGTNTGTADLTVTKTLLTDLVRATLGGNLPWNSAGTQSLALLDPAGSLAGAQTAPTVDWVQNIAAQQVGNATAMVNTTAGTFYSPPQGVARGATSVALAGQTVPAFTASTTRAFLFNYRMLDGSNKSVVYRYN